LLSDSTTLHDRSPSVAPARRETPADSLPSAQAGRHADLLATSLTLCLGSKRALSDGAQRAARVLRDDHESPEGDDRESELERRSSRARRVMCAGAEPHARPQHSVRFVLIESEPASQQRTATAPPSRRQPPVAARTPRDRRAA